MSWETYHWIGKGGLGLYIWARGKGDEMNLGILAKLVPCILAPLPQALLIILRPQAE